jgi:hypothetical protein
MQKNIKMHSLPFYDLLEVLVPPIVLTPSDPFQKSQTSTFDICLSDVHIFEISKYRNAHNRELRVLLRLCLFNQNSEQKDAYPTIFNLEVNGRLFPLPKLIPYRPGEIPKRPAKPLDVTDFLKIIPGFPNKVIVRWEQDKSNVNYYSIGGLLVRKKSLSMPHIYTTFLDEKTN